jgi:hypothetical protein
VTRRRPSESLQREIVQTHSVSNLSFRPTPANLPFRQKLVSVDNFVPETHFRTLCDVAKHQVRSERVHIPVHKRGATISYHDLHYGAPEIIAFYLSPVLHAWCSEVIGDRVHPTPLNDLSSCSLLIYDYSLSQFDRRGHRTHRVPG